MATADRLTHDAERSLPVLSPAQTLDIERLRYPREKFYLIVIYIFNALVLLGGLALLMQDWSVLPYVAGGLLAVYLLHRLAFLLFYWFLFGNSVRVSPLQYSELYRAVQDACSFLDLRPTPTVFVMQGHGVLELFVMKRFVKRGILVFTSQLVDDLLAAGDSRELMMIIGRQLGHIKAGHFKGWVFKDVIGRFTYFLHAAWWRRCHLTADRVGYLVCGQLDAARKALLVVTVGKRLAQVTSTDALREQDDELSTSWLARFRLLLSTYPYMIHRVMELHSFQSEVKEAKATEAEESAKAIALLPPTVSTFNIVIHGNAIIGDQGVLALPTAD